MPQAALVRSREPHVAAAALAGGASGALSSGGQWCRGAGTSAMASPLRRAAASLGSSSESTGGAAAGEAGAEAENIAPDASARLGAAA